MREALTDFQIELRALLEVLYLKFHHDFRGYAASSMERRMKLALENFKIETLSQLQDRLVREPAFFSELFRYLTIPTTEMFRDPEFFKSFRERVVPVLRTYPSFKLWIAGCSTGEEVYSYSILLREEGLADRMLIYATDINLESLQKAAAGVFHADRLKDYTANYVAAGGRKAFSDYYVEAYDRVLFDSTLKQNIVFSEHSLSTDEVFAEVDVVSCRNVMIYFNQGLQDRAIGLFANSLSRHGVLCIGSKESLRFSKHYPQFEEFDSSHRIYRKKGRME